LLVNIVILLPLQ